MITVKTFLSNPDEQIIMLICSIWCLQSNLLSNPSGNICVCLVPFISDSHCSFVSYQILLKLATECLQMRSWLKLRCTTATRNETNELNVLSIRTWLLFLLYRLGVQMRILFKKIYTTSVHGIPPSMDIVVNIFRLSTSLMAFLLTWKKKLWFPCAAFIKNN